MNHHMVPASGIEAVPNHGCLMLVNFNPLNQLENSNFGLPVLEFSMSKIKVLNGSYGIQAEILERNSISIQHVPVHASCFLSWSLD